MSKPNYDANISNVWKCTLNALTFKDPPQITAPARNLDKFYHVSY